VVLYHNRFAEAGGWIRESSRFAVKDADGSKRLVTGTLAEALGVADGPADDRWVAYRDQRSGLEHLRSVAELRERGLHVHLRAYESRVLWQFRVLADTSGVWRRVAEQLGGAGLPSLEDALRELALAPVHGALRSALDAPADASVARLVDAVAEATRTAGDRAAVTAGVLAQVAASRVTARTIEDASQRAAFDAYVVLARLGSLPAGADADATIRAWFEELRLGPVLASVARGHGLDEAAAWAAVDRVRALLELPLPGVGGGAASGRPARLLDAWLERPALRGFLRVNTWEGAGYLHRESFEELVAWMERLDRLATPAEARLRAPIARSVVARRLLAAGAEGGYRLDRMRELLAAPASRPLPGTVAATTPRLPKATGLPPGPTPQRRGRGDIA
jgi:hypothetical protein